jgi:hypothetical protein
MLLNLLVPVLATVADIAHAAEVVQAAVEVAADVVVVGVTVAAVGVVVVTEDTAVAAEVATKRVQLNFKGRDKSCGLFFF